MSHSISLLCSSEQNRKLAAVKVKKKKKSELGQFFTPSNIATFMAGMFEHKAQEVRLLDPGAGTGSLTAAFVHEICSREVKPSSIVVHLFEVDTSIIEYLNRTMECCKKECNSKGIVFTAKIINKDFIKTAADLSSTNNTELPHDYFNYVVMNPPYKKIRNNSEHKKLLNGMKIDVTNMYTAFLAISERILCQDGELVAITPRSFCNGPYFRNFRYLFFNSMKLHKVHLFESRNDLFTDDEVLQENIIFHAVKNQVKRPIHVLITSSYATDFSDLNKNKVSTDAVITPSDPEMFIRLPISAQDYNIAKIIESLPNTLKDLEINVSTGKVVDFRSRQFLLTEQQTNTVPLIYSVHFENIFVQWPSANTDKPQFIIVNEMTRKSHLIPCGYYVLLRRFTSKEEKRRVKAFIYDPTTLQHEYVGFENHLNYFHSNGAGLTEEMAFGLFAFLNSTIVDEYFRSFNGHTQVNATDLRSIRYPSEFTLNELGIRVKAILTQKKLSQEIIDEVVKNAICSKQEMEACNRAGFQHCAG